MVTQQPRILVILTWFGNWPGWTRLFLESCRWNETIDWLIVTDCGEPENIPENVRLLHTSFADYRALVGARLGIEPQWTKAYKLCDLKPALGAVHADALEGYDYWGFGDLDVIYGDIRAFYTPQVLRYDLISSHTHIVAGHFSLLRTSPAMRDAFKRISGWKNLLARDSHCSFDEQIFSRMFLPMDIRRPWRRLMAPYIGGALLREQFSTNIAPLPWVDGTRDYPTEWYWREGKLTNNRTGDRQFLYLHLSHWQSNRWTSQAVAPWSKIQNIDHVPPGQPRAFRINRDGFSALEECVEMSVKIAT